MQMITLMMGGEALFLEETQTGINEEWSKNKTNRMKTWVTETMMKIKNNNNNKNRIDL